MNRTQNSPKWRKEKQLSARLKHWNHLQVTDRPSPDAPSLTQAIIVQMHGLLCLILAYDIYCQSSEVYSIPSSPAVVFQLRASQKEVGGCKREEHLRCQSFIAEEGRKIVGIASNKPWVPHLTSLPPNNRECFYHCMFTLPAQQSLVDVHDTPLMYWWHQLHATLCHTSSSTKNATR